MDLFWLALAVGAGGCIALQAAANGALRANIASVWYAAFYSICGTILTAVLFMLAARPAGRLAGAAMVFAGMLMVRYL